MDTLANIEFFAATVDAGSFAAAARKLGVTASAVSRRVAQLEEEFGVALLARTTRTLNLTTDGRAFYERCTRILEELREAREGVARARKKPSGMLRVDVPIALGRFVIAPRIEAFLDRYPDISVSLTLRDQFVDPIAEGIDVLVRMGPLEDSTLIARRLGDTRVVVCAAPAYLRKHGQPKTPRDLAKHQCIGFLREGRPSPWRFTNEQGTYSVEINGRYHANDAEVMRSGAIAGKGLVSMFDFLVADALARRELVPVLEDFPSTMRAIHALYPNNRHLVPKVRVFLDFLSDLFASTGRAARGKTRGRS